MRTEILLAVFASLFLATSSRAQTTVVLRPGDAFELRLGGVSQEYAAEFALQYTIDQDGTVNVPLIGKMRAAGLRSAQFERAVETKLVANQIFTHPTVLLNVAATNRHVSICGGVRTPQRLQWSPDLTLSSAIAECGGTSDFAGSKIRLIRDGKVAGIYRLTAILKEPNTDPKLLPGDQVVVPE